MLEEKSQELELHGSLWDHRNAMEDVLNQLGKVQVLLEHLGDQYGWNEKPDLRAAIAWMNRSPGESLAEGRDLLGEHSCDWFTGYGDIMTFLDIVGDYVCDSERCIRDVIAGNIKRSV